jgi:hypothetical protein
MGSNNEMTRKEFITLTFTLIGATAVGACSDTNTNVTGIAGTYGALPVLAAARDGRHHGHRRNRRYVAHRHDGTGGTGTAACADPLHETQSASDHARSRFRRARWT